jgi:hypothetical protein
VEVEDAFSIPFIGLSPLQSKKTSICAMGFWRSTRQWKRHHSQGPGS